MNELLLVENNEIQLEGFNNKILKFLDREIDPKTRGEYERTIRNFFKVDSILDITMEQVVNVTVDHAEAYRDSMISAGILNRGTIKTYIIHMRSLYNFLMIQCTNNRLKIRLLESNPFNIKVKLTGKSVPKENRPLMYGSFTRKEVSSLIKVTIPEMKLFYEMATRTAIRKESLLKLKINRDFSLVDGNWCVSVEWDKTAPVVAAITNDMYDACAKLASRSLSGEVFMMSSGTPNNRLHKDCLLIGLTKEEIERRHLTIHSLKKASGVMTKHLTNGNLLMMRDKLHHSTTKMADKNYSQEEYDPANDIGLQFKIIDCDIDKEFESYISNMSNWELRDLLRGLNPDIKNGLLDKIVKQKAV